MKLLWILVALCAASAFGQNSYGPDFLNLHCTAPDPLAQTLFNIPPRPGFVPDRSPNGNAILYCDTASGTLKASFNGGAYSSLGGPLGIPRFTVPTLPGSLPTGTVVQVTDGSGAGDCTVGGGTILSICQWTGSAWVAWAGPGSGTITFGSPSTNYFGFGSGVNSFPPHISGITNAGNYPPVPATGYGYAGLDIAPPLFTAPPPTVAGTTSRSIMGINSALATSFPDTFNVFAINGQLATPTSYSGNQWAWYGMYHESDHNGSGTLHLSYSVFGAGYNSGNGTCTTCVGGHFEAVGNFYNRAVTPLTTNNVGLQCNAGVTSGGTHTHDICMEVMTPFTGGTFTNGHIGLLIDDQTNGGVLPSAVALQIGSGNNVKSGLVDLGANNITIESQGSGFLTLQVPTTAIGNEVFNWPLPTQSGVNTGTIETVNRVTSQRTETGADTNLLTFTPPAQTGSYRICFTLDLSAANAATLGWTATWTDSNGTAQTPTNLALNQIGVAAPALTFTTSVTANYYDCEIITTNNSGTSIVVKTTFSGTSFTGKASASIERLM